MKNLGLAFVLTFVACGKGEDTGGTAGAAAAQTVAVRLLGVGASGPVLVRVAAIALTVDGSALPAQPNDSELDLGKAQNAWDVTTFGLPVAARQLGINLQFQPAGTVALNGKTQPLDLSGPPVSLVADAAQMRTGGEVVLQIDLARSLIDQGDQVFLLPDFIVLY